MKVKVQHPLISIILPVYNAEKYIKLAVLSMLRQSYRNLEIIVINDCSIDSTLKILTEISKIDNRVLILNNEENLGISTSLNKGILYSKGDFIARMDADDISLQNRIMMQYKFLTRFKLDIIGSNILTFGNNSTKRSKYFSDKNQIKVASLFGCPMAHPTIFAKRDVLLSNFYNADSKVEDYNLWNRLLNNGYSFGNISKPLLRYRIHQSNLSNLSNKEKGAKLIKDYITEIRNANLVILNEKLTSEEIDILFLNKAMLNSFNYNINCVQEVFNRYYNNINKLYNVKSISAFKKLLSLKFFEKILMMSLKYKRPFFKAFFRMKFNIFRFNPIKYLIIFLVSKELL
jgi:glycosyltransferase involved in cell wall biosynthesis